MEKTLGDTWVIKVNVIEEMMAAGVEKCLARQAAGPEGVLVIEGIDHELTQFDGKAQCEMHVCGDR
jgi:hypothetical protein